MKSLRSRSWLFSDVFSCLSVASLDSRQCNLQILIFDFPYYLKSLEVCRTWEFRILKRSLNLFLLRLLSAMTHPTLILLPLAGKGLWTLFAAVGDPIPTLLASLAAMSRVVCSSVFTCLFTIFSFFPTFTYNLLRNSIDHNQMLLARKQMKIGSLASFAQTCQATILPKNCLW